MRLTESLDSCELALLNVCLNGLTGWLAGWLARGLCGDCASVYCANLYQPLLISVVVVGYALTLCLNNGVRFRICTSRRRGAREVLKLL